MAGYAPLSKPRSGGSDQAAGLEDAKHTLKSVLWGGAWSKRHARGCTVGRIRPRPWSGAGRNIRGVHLACGRGEGGLVASLVV